MYFYFYHEQVLLFYFTLVSAPKIFGLDKDRMKFVIFTPIFFQKLYLGILLSLELDPSNFMV